MTAPEEVRTIRAGLVVRGDTVYLPGRGKGPAVRVRITRATQGYRDQDRGRPDADRQRRRLEGVTDDGQTRTWLRPFGERLAVARLVNDPAPEL